ncbi:hypothetical protein NUH87_31105 [Pseudomonas batumici]|uniref:hypothetical protein n=1 Tax=Pseudomonas batumici TaxID=226910 RepID=UPI0030D15232
MDLKISDDGTFNISQIESNWTQKVRGFFKSLAFVGNSITTRKIESIYTPARVALEKDNDGDCVACTELMNKLISDCLSDYKSKETHFTRIGAALVVFGPHYFQLNGSTEELKKRYDQAGSVMKERMRLEKEEAEKAKKIKNLIRLELVELKKTGAVFFKKLIPK